MYINYNMNQLYLPTDLGAEIPPNYVARVINDAVDRLSDAIFESGYPGGGRAYSGRIRPCIPVESVHAFRRKLTADSGDNRPPIPVRIDRLKA